MKGYGYRWVICIVLACTSSVLMSQSKEALEKERQKLIKDIEKTNNYLKTTQKEKTATINDISVINKRAEDRKKLITNVQQDILNADNTLKDNERKKDSIKNAYIVINNQYKSLLRYNYLQVLSNHKLSYLLSSESLNTFLIRYRYIKQYEAYQRVKKEEIIQLQKLLVQADEQILNTKEQKASLLAIEKEQVVKLEKEKEEKNKALTSISKKESELKKELSKKQSEREKLNKAIEDIILAQLKAAKSREEANSGDKTLNANEVKLSGNFNQNKGSLPWPVDHGIVVTRFGKQSHPTLKGVTVESNGIDIAITGQASIKSIFEGEVVGITKVIGNENMLIISHGTFFSVYSNIDDVTVRKGDKVSRGQLVGAAYPKSNGKSEIHFELWQNKSKLNPESWLIRR